MPHKYLFSNKKTAVVFLVALAMLSSSFVVYGETAAGPDFQLGLRVWGGKCGQDTAKASEEVNPIYMFTNFISAGSSASEWSRSPKGETRCAQINLNTNPSKPIPSDTDIRIGIILGQGNLCEKKAGVIQYSNWASDGGGWSKLARTDGPVDPGANDPNCVKIVLETRPFPGVTNNQTLKITDFRFATQPVSGKPDNKESLEYCSETKGDPVFLPESITPWASVGGGESNLSSAGDTNPECMRVRLDAKYSITDIPPPPPPCTAGVNCPCDINPSDPGCPPPVPVAKLSIEPKTLQEVVEGAGVQFNAYLDTDINDDFVEKIDKTNEATWTESSNGVIASTFNDASGRGWVNGVKADPNPVTVTATWSNLSDTGSVKVNAVAPPPEDECETPPCDGGDDDDGCAIPPCDGGDGGHEPQCTVSVEPTPLKKGKTATATFTYDGTLIESGVDWSLVPPDDTIATIIDENGGVIKGNGKGTVEIRGAYTGANGFCEATADLTVISLLRSIFHEILPGL